MRKPHLGRERGQAACSTSPRATWRSWVRPSSASPGRQGFGGCVRARFPHPKQGEPGILIAGHLDTVHPVGTIEKAEMAARRQQMLRPRHLRHEGRQLPVAGSDPATGPRFVHDAAADHRAVHAGRGSRHALDPRHHRSRSRAQQIRAGARARYVRATASPPAAMRSRASISKPSAGPAMPAPRCRTAAPRSAKWRSQIVAHRRA